MLEIDEALRRGDHVEIELLDLADFLAAVIFGARARDGDVDALEIGLQVARPILALARQIAERLFRRALPAFVAEVGERIAHRSRENHRAVVPRHIGFTVGRRALRVAVLVIARIPAARADIDPATHREMIVEHSNLLVMAAPHGMRAVEAEADRARQSPAHDHRQDARHRELLEPADIPAKDSNVARGRSEDSRVGKEGVITYRSVGSPDY